VDLFRTALIACSEVSLGIYVSCLEDVRLASASTSDDGAVLRVLKVNRKYRESLCESSVAIIEAA
jgi:hypothetical protein